MPADASVLIVAGPKTDFFPGEIDMLKTYLAKGGKICCLLDPPERADSAPLTNLIALAQGLGHRGRQQHRGRRQRHGPAARDRRVGAGGRQLPSASDHRATSTC